MAAGIYPGTSSQLINLGSMGGDLAGNVLRDSVSANGLITVNGGSAGILITDTAADHGARIRAPHGAGGVDSLTIDTLAGVSAGGSLVGTNFSSGTTARLNAFGPIMAAGGYCAWTSGAAVTNTVDTTFYRQGASLLRFANGAYGTGYWDVNTAATVKGQVLTNTSLVSSATITGASPYTFTGAIPAASILVGVTARVTTAITSGTATSYKLGVAATGLVAADDDLFGTALPFTVSSTVGVANYTAVLPTIFTVAGNITVTSNDASNFTAGVVAVTVHYIALTPATSN